jgi:FtsP/CotA-like multicopper oxidase with cupredoxin domain
MRGFLGEQVLVSGQFPRTKELQGGPHRLRILNGSNSRIYDLGWSDGSPLTVLGTDGGLLDAPLDRSHVVLAPGQRLDVWADFGGGVSNDVWLESRGFEDPASTMGMGGGMGGRGAVAVANGAALRIQRFVARSSGPPARPPKTLTTTFARRELETSGAITVKTFPIGMGGMRWLLNGGPFQMRGIAANERVRRGTVEDWEFVNPAGAMSMAHPIHVHGSQFRIIERQPGPGSTALRSGILDDGWQDTVLVLPGDRVRIRKRFEHYAGLFLYHCHNLEHEDMGMMRNFLVEST